MFKGKRTSSLLLLSIAEFWFYRFHDRKALERNKGKKGKGAVKAFH